MSTPTPTLSVAAKSKLAGAAAVVLAGVTAWQAATRDGFTWLDVVPVVAVVAGAVATDLVPNTPDQPVAKAIVHGALSAVAAAASAVAAFAAADPAGVTAVKLLVVAAGTLLVFYVPELAPTLGPTTAGGRVTAVEVTDALRLVTGDHAPSMGPEPAAGPLPPVPAVTPRQVDAVPSAAYLVRDLPAAAAGPTPIGDAALAAATATAPMPAVTTTA